MAPHSSILAWRIPETQEPSGLPSMGSHRVGHDWSNLAAAAAAAYVLYIYIQVSIHIYIYITEFLCVFFIYIKTESFCCIPETNNVNQLLKKRFSFLKRIKIIIQMNLYKTATDSQNIENKLMVSKGEGREVKSGVWDSKLLILYIK